MQTYIRTRWQKGPGSGTSSLTAAANMCNHKFMFIGETPLPAAARKRFFAKARNREGRLFTTDHTYTFHFWQHMLDLASFKLDLGFKSFDLANHLDGQPLQ